MNEFILIVFMTGQMQVVPTDKPIDKERCESAVRATKAAIKELGSTEMPQMFCVPKEQWLGAQKSVSK